MPGTVSAVSHAGRAHTHAQPGLLPGPERGREPRGCPATPGWDGEGSGSGETPGNPPALLPWNRAGPGQRGEPPPHTPPGRAREPPTGSGTHRREIAAHPGTGCRHLGRSRQWLPRIPPRLARYGPTRPSRSVPQAGEPLSRPQAPGGPRTTPSGGGPGTGRRENNGEEGSAATPPPARPAARSRP